MLRRVKSADELYEEVRGYDLVLTVDAPLATALNARLQEPRLGLFAATPKEIAAQEAVHHFTEPMLNTYDLIVRVARAFGLRIKTAHHMVFELLDVWERRGTLDQRIIQRHLGEQSVRIAGFLQTLPSIYRARELSSVGRSYSSRVAVIGIEQFTQLDRRVLGQGYDTVSIESPEGSREMPQVHVFGSEKSLVDTVVSMINPENADDVAIVLNPQSSYLPLIKSKLVNSDIPVLARTLLGDDFSVRTFIGLLELAFNIDECRVKEAAAYFSTFGASLPPRYYQYLLAEYMRQVPAREQARQLYDFLRNISTKRFGEVLSEVSRTLELPEQLLRIVEQLGLRDAYVTQESLHELRYFLEHFEVETGKHPSGVLLVDALNSAYVNRPVCFFLGLDSSWTRSVSNLPWLDVKHEEEVQLRQFETLLQQGNERYYFVNALRQNQNVVPCYYFNLLSGRTIEGFEDPLFSPIHATSPEDETPYAGERELVPEKKTTLSLFSQSSLKDMVLCPKRYAYSQLDYDCDYPAFLKGNLLHDFAAFYVSYPDFVKEKGKDKFVSLMVEKYKQMVGEENIDINTTMFHIGVRNIISFLEGYIDSLAPIDDMGLVAQEHSNFFAEAFDMPLQEKNAEAYFEDPELGLKGIIDLVINHAMLIDYKSSRYVFSPPMVIRKALPQLIRDDADFQALAYLAELRRISPGRVLRFMYHFFVAGQEEVIEGETSQDRRVVEVRYYPGTFADFLCADEAYEYLGSSRKQRDFISLVGQQNIQGFFSQRRFPAEYQFDKKALLSSDYRRAFIDYLRGQLSFSLSSLEGDCDAFLKTVVSVRLGYKGAIFFSEDVDAFEELLERKRGEVNTMLATYFPYRPLTRELCKRCEYIDRCLRQHERSHDLADAGGN